MRYQLEIVRICSSHVCANYTYKFWQLLNQPTSHGPFRPKLWMPLATIFVEIFQKEKNWWGSGPIGVTSWKDFEISLKKWRFEFFRQAKASTFKMSMLYLISYSNLSGRGVLRKSTIVLSTKIGVPETVPSNLLSG